MKKAKITIFQWRLVGLILILAVGTLLYDLLYKHKLEQTAALFIGLPAFLAIAITLAPKARSTTGMILKGMTIALLLSGILLREGFICIIMAAPIAYLVGGIIGFVIDRSRDRDGSRGVYSVVIFVVLLFSLEGVHPALTFPGTEVVRVERVIAAGSAEIEQALSRKATWDQSLPFYLRLGFPRPLLIENGGLAVGNQWTVHFSGPAGLYREGPAGDLSLLVEARTENQVRFRILSDTSHVRHWLKWQASDVQWTPVSPTETRVIWTFYYERQLAPAWYFSPWERYAVGLAGSHLINTLATP